MCLKHTDHLCIHNYVGHEYFSLPVVSDMVHSGPRLGMKLALLGVAGAVPRWPTGYRHSWMVFMESTIDKNG